MLHIGLLGAFKIAVGSEPVTSLNAPRLQSFLAYLLIHRSAPQPRQEMAFQFWPDSSEAQARSNLRYLIVALRHALPGSELYIGADRHTLQWRSDNPYTLDVADFEQALNLTQDSHDHSYDKIRALRAAVDLYSGDLLPGCYDEWIAAPRERLRQGFLQVLQQLISTCERANELSSAILYARRLLRHDPLHEEFHRLLMRLYVANGDSAAALTVYRRCEAILKRELGVEPSPATLEVARRIKKMNWRQQPELADVAHRGTGGKEGASDQAVAVANNLPASTTLFIGREREISALSDLLRARNIRLVTITGTPGTGKTRLALQVAESALISDTASPTDGEFRDGVYFVPLAPIDEPDLVASVIAHTIGVPENANRPAAEALMAYLRDKSLLLLLDNFEHLLPAAFLVAELLSTCPRLKVLVTSRATLNLRGEHEYALPPMAIPSQLVLTSTALVPDDLMQYEAVALFVERALEVAPTFTLTRANAQAVGEICRRLEGVPLAIELASARVKMLSPEAILSRLDRRLKLLVGGRLDLPPRQRTLEAAIAWSYNLLNQAERALFRRLAVFSGGCSVEACEAIIDLDWTQSRVPITSGGPSDEQFSNAVLDNMTALVNKSLLWRLASGQAEKPPRFYMLETIREFALDRLRESGEEEALERKHARYFMALAERAEPQLVSLEQGEWMDRLEDDHENFRTALRWAREGANRAPGVKQHEAVPAGSPTSPSLEASEVGLRLASALMRFWNIRGYQSEGRDELAALLATAQTIAAPNGQPPWHRSEDTRRESAIEEAQLKAWQAHMARALFAAGDLAILQDDQPSARPLHEQSLAIRREIGDKRGVADSLDSLGFMEHFRGDYLSARSLYEQSLAIRREIGDKLGTGYSLFHIGALAIQSEADYVEARSLLKQSLSIEREVGDKSAIALTLGSLGRLAQLEGDLTMARSLHEQSLAIMREVGHRGGIAETLGILASVACSQGDYPSSRALYQESLLIRHEIGDRYGIAACLAGLGWLALVHDGEEEGATKASVSTSLRTRAERGARLLGAVEALVEAIGGRLIGDEGKVYERGVAAARDALEEAGFNKASNEGKAMKLEEAIALAEGPD